MVYERIVDRYCARRHRTPSRAHESAQPTESHQDGWSMRGLWTATAHVGTALHLEHTRRVTPAWPKRRPLSRSSLPRDLTAPRVVPSKLSDLRRARPCLLHARCGARVAILVSLAPLFP